MTDSGLCHWFESSEEGEESCGRFIPLDQLSPRKTVARLTVGCFQHNRPIEDIRPHHSITSSARASSVGGRVRANAFAVFRLIRSSNLVA